MLCLVREKQVFMISEGDAHKRRGREPLQSLKFGCRCPADKGNMLKGKHKKLGR